MKHYKIDSGPDGNDENARRNLIRLFNLSYLRYTNKTRAAGVHDLPALSCNTLVLPDYIALSNHPGDFHRTPLTAVAFYLYDVCATDDNALEIFKYAIEQGVEVVIPNNMLKERNAAKKKGVKFSREDMVFVTRDATGQVVWLESGNPGAGLEHVLHGNGTTKGHAVDFKKALGLSESEVPGYLHKVITHGEVISNQLRPLSNGRMGYTRVYYYGGRYNIITGIGTNGFITSAYPTRRSDS